MPEYFPDCFVDIYPFEGGTLQLTKAQLISCATTKDIGQEFGTFTIELPPGGPNGLEIPPFWSDILTQMSLVVIAMTRGTAREIVMLGVVQSITETQEWNTGASTQRSITVTGVDFGYFFSMFTFSTLWYLGSQGFGLSTSSSPGQGFLTVLGDGVLQGDPGSVAAGWFNTIMAGSQGVMSNTFVPFHGAQVKFPDAMAQIFDKYDAYIPQATFFADTEGSWTSKFKMICPFPWYEFFVTTINDINFYATGPGGTAGGGSEFTSSGLDASTIATPIVVARTQPLPQLTTSISNGVPTFDGIDTTIWEKLPLYVPLIGPGSFLNSVITFNDAQVQNFYHLNPTFLRRLLGDSNSSVIPYVFSFSAAGDSASIRRYGFRPAEGSFSWLADPTGNIAQGSQAGNLQDLAGKLLARLCSYWHPTPLMAQATLTLPLRPDIYPGARFRYQPYKDDTTWDFYISGVAHKFIFGGPSTTILTLVRGLPTAIYADTGSNGLLYNIHIGNARRMDGIYTLGVGIDGAEPLKALSMDQFQQFLSEIGKVYVTPQQP